MTCGAASPHPRLQVVCVCVCACVASSAAICCPFVPPSVASKSVYNLCLGQAHWFQLNASKTPWLGYLLYRLSLSLSLALPLLAFLVLCLSRPALLGLRLAPFDFLTVAHGKIQTILCLDFVVLIASLVSDLCFGLGFRSALALPLLLSGFLHPSAKLPLIGSLSAAGCLRCSALLPLLLPIKLFK